MEEKIKAFLEEYGVLVEKHKIDFASYPMWVPNKEGHWTMVVKTEPVDISNRPVKTPFVEKA